MGRPSIKSPCVADRYADQSRERIAEFSTPSGKGGLISIIENDNGEVLVSVYRCDPGVTVRAEPELSHKPRWDGDTGQRPAAN